MMNKRVVITGIGVISSCGIGKDAFLDAIFSGNSGIKPISLFDTSGFSSKMAGEIKDFKPEEFLGAKGLRTLDRSIKLTCSAVKLALDNAGIVVNEENTYDTGVVIGSALGSLSSICGFDRDALVDGVQYVNPAFFPNTVINSPASQVSIKFAIKGFNATISTGATASLEALSYAAEFIRLGRANTVLAGGVEELCLHTFLGFYKSGCLASSPEVSCPFDKRRNGAILGEGACVLVLENLDCALKRGAKIYAQICGSGASYDAQGINKYNPDGAGLKRAMLMALEESGLPASDIDYICAGANSSKDADRIEARAIKESFCGKNHSPRVSSIKSVIGETFSASGAFQAAAAIGAIERQTIPATINYLEPDPECDLNFVLNEPQPHPVNNALVNAFGPTGCNASLMMSGYKG